MLILNPSSKWNSYTTEELGDIFSDYYKDVNGFRPRHVSNDDRIGLIEGLDTLDNYMASMRLTEQGRAQLEEEGWVL